MWSVFKKQGLSEKPISRALKRARSLMLRTTDAGAVNQRLGGGTNSRKNFYTFARVFRIRRVSLIDLLLRRPWSVKAQTGLI